MLSSRGTVRYEERGQGYYCRWELVQRSPVNFRYAGTVACGGGRYGPVNCYRARFKFRFVSAAYVSHEYSIAARFYSQSCIYKEGTLICAVVWSKLRTPSEGENSCEDTVFVFLLFQPVCVSRVGLVSW
jgi:hypothetical protein